MTDKYNTWLPTLRPKLSTSFIGFDRIFDEVSKTLASGNIPNNGYPPINIVEVDEDHYSIELAVAGFNEEDINITLHKNMLKIEGQKNSDDSINYIHQGISNRAFSKTFTLSDHITVKDTVLNNGLLRINLERNIPEEEKPKKIEINNTSPQLLNE